MRGRSRRIRAAGGRVEIRGRIVAAAVSVTVRLGAWVCVAVAVSVALILVEATKHWCVAVYVRCTLSVAPIKRTPTTFASVESVLLCYGPVSSPVRCAGDVTNEDEGQRMNRAAGRR
jgi:hypothetical protein